jgi:hypothetical protein
MPIPLPAFRSHAGFRAKSLLRRANRRPIHPLPSSRGQLVKLRAIVRATSCGLETPGRRPLTLGDAVSAQSFQLTANGRHDEIGVNHGDVFALWQGNGGLAPPDKTPQTLWWYVMVFVLASAGVRRVGK